MKIRFSQLPCGMFRAIDLDQVDESNGYATGASREEALDELLAKAEVDMTDEDRREVLFLESIGAKVDGFVFTIRELRETFERVAPVGNWKNPIDTTVEISFFGRNREAALLEASVAFMTGSVAKLVIVSTIDLNRLSARITADGYFAAVGS